MGTSSFATPQHRASALLLALLFLTASALAQPASDITLLPPDLNRGGTLMKALQQRASAKDFNAAAIPLRELSDLLWAANGINRAESGKRTAPSAIDARDIDVYVCNAAGAYLYQPDKQKLRLVAAGDHRAAVAGRQEAMARAPLFCVLVSDLSRFSRGDDVQKQRWAAEDAGIVSQNISLFCAAAGLATRVRATMDEEKLRKVLQLTASQVLLLNHPVGKGK